MKEGDKFTIKGTPGVAYRVFELSDSFVIYRAGGELRVVSRCNVLVEPERRYIARAGCVICVSDGAPSHNDSTGWTFPGTSNTVRVDLPDDFIPDGSCFEIKLIEVEKDEDN
jgi:hypothetical protein